MREFTEQELVRREKAEKIADDFLEKMNPTSQNHYIVIFLSQADLNSQ